MTEPQEAAVGQSKSEAVLESITELQQIELQILLDVAAVCEQLNIEFFLGEGTLLGAIRHNGFIPWDDDIDLVMRRSEYRRFLELAPPLLAPRYIVQHPSTVDDYWSPFMKIRRVDTDHRYRQAHIAHLTSDNGPLIDIFPVEEVPAPSGARLWLQAKYIRFLRGAISQKLRIRKVKRWQHRLMRVGGDLVPMRFIHHQLEWAFNWFNGKERPYVANLASYHPIANQVVPAHVYASQLRVPFEGHPMPVPVGYDELLTRTYGDYMTLPPEHKRVIKHKFVMSGE